MEKTCKTGVTLLELVIVSSLIGIISLALFSTFQNGMKLLRRAERSSAGEDVNLMLSRMRTDVKNSLVFADSKLKGTETGFEVMTLVSAPWMHRKTVGRVSYAFDKTAGALIREESDFSGMYLQQASPAKETAGGVSRAVFNYCYLDPKTLVYRCETEWQRDDLVFPVALALELEFFDGTRAQTYYVHELFPLGWSVCISGCD